jgi:Tol biopolymer transport system component
MDWSRDGRFLLFDAVDPKTADDLWVLALDGARKANVVLQTPARERLPQFSPDTRWIAYESDKTGRSEVYVRPFPGPGADIPVSVNGGAQVRWNPNGQELFYLSADDRLMAVPVQTGTGASIELGTPVPLFATTIASRAINTNRQLYVVAADGQSFMMNSVPESDAPRTINLILNWRPLR